MLFALVVASSQIDIPGPAGSGSFGETVAVLPNGNLVICDPGYDAGSITDVGAAYLYDGADGTLISMLTGSKTSDWICDGGITVLANGNYLVVSPHWDNGAAWDVGAVTWGDGTTGVAGPVSAANSLVGSSTGDHVGLIYWSQRVVTALSNGNYVVNSRDWDNGAAADAGAVTWGDGTTGIRGTVSAANSLVGSSPDDHIGDHIYSLANGNYVVNSRDWDNGAAADAGAVTWGDGTTGIRGTVSAANSLVGSFPGDYVGGWGTTALANGNYLVRSPRWDNGAVADAGAVTWANGATGITGPVSTANSLVGSSAGDMIGLHGLYELANGNYVVESRYWDNGVGAVTWGDGTTGVAGPVSAANSLVGSSANDHVGIWGVTALSNGNYLVKSPDWDNGIVGNAGAVTWGDGTKGVTGLVSAANSLVGSSPSDQIGRGTPITIGKDVYSYSSAVIELANGNYVVSSAYWDNGAMADAGAVTWGDGTTGITGPVSSANSLVGSSAYDQVGSKIMPQGTVNSVDLLANGNYLVGSPNWDNGSVADAGAVTWADGTTGITGTISAANSLVGSSPGDQIGNYVELLDNGNYLVVIPIWDNGAASDAGAVAWGNGATGIAGPVSAGNSLVGSSAGDQVGYWGVRELANGNYVVESRFWNNGAATNAGAVTWGDGTTGITGPVSAANSLVGSSSGDQVGYLGVTALSNGNYVVSSHLWDYGTVTDAGAATWGDGTTGITGTISAANSLVGSLWYDEVGLSVSTLSNGNYVVSSPYWDNGSAGNTGAVTWGNGETGIAGPVSAANSLVGSSSGDQVGNLGVTALSNGNYVVESCYWDNGAATNAGAVTWGDGTIGITGPVSAANSLVGSTAYDQVGSLVGPGPNVVMVNSVDGLANGNYVVLSPDWDNGSVADAGAVTWGDGATGTRGPITAENSVRGEAAGGGLHMFYKYDPYNEQLAVSRPADNTVILFRPNRVPVAEAGRPLITARGALVRLDGSASYDPDGNLPLQFEWTQTGGPPVVLSDPHAISPTFTAPDERTSLTFNLVVTDALGSSSKPSMAIVFVDPYQYFLPLTPEH